MRTPGAVSFTHVFGEPEETSRVASLLAANANFAQPICAPQPATSMPSTVLRSRILRTCPIKRPRAFYCTVLRLVK